MTMIVIVTVTCGIALVCVLIYCAIAAYRADDAHETNEEIADAVASSEEWRDRLKADIYGGSPKDYENERHRMRS